MPFRRAMLPVAFVVLLAPGVHAAEPPIPYCQHVGIDDTRRPIDGSLVAAAKRLFDLNAPDDAVRRTTMFRCMEHDVLVCNTGANLPCGKANTGRRLTGAMDYCRKNPGASSIPMFVTGHDTIYAWRCQGIEAEAGTPVEQLDSRGFIARLWKNVTR